MPSITDYASLKVQVKSWLRRGDLDALIPQFISLAESRMNRVLDTQYSEKRVSGVLTHPLPLPSDMNSVRSLSIVTSSNQSKSLEYITPQKYESYGPQMGYPVKFTIEAQNAYFLPQPDSDVYNYVMLYDANFPELSDLNTTNTLLQQCPDAYLFGSLCEARAFIGEAQFLQVWEVKFEQAIQSIREQNMRARYGSSPLAITVI